MIGYNRGRKLLLVPLVQLQKLNNRAVHGKKNNDYAHTVAYTITFQQTEILVNSIYFQIIPQRTPSTLIINPVGKCCFRK